MGKAGIGGQAAGRGSATSGSAGHMLSPWGLAHLYSLVINIPSLLQLSVIQMTVKLGAGAPASSGLGRLRQENCDF